MNPNFSKKDFLEILCLKLNIPKTAPAVPPKKVHIKSVFSEIRRLCFLAKNLSYPNIPNDIIFIIKITKYISVIFQK